ncbi:DEAD/DEAH box helicase [Brevibacillus ruminantium]|uniref:DEAD-box ATP-dependent RNA helicase CshA n=1 Tax=Brevibacillus ruminantium TaxID=2950604 RepID=A0ABY4WET2_9BACL|nr:DEAD/DEAH box helicase [Brevibacillus ruminantium]USG65553.1 DEAD/DEAH box helicase [Brevibacillus ruminantium]
MATFYEFGLDHLVARALSDMGFEEATPIQEETIPTVLQGKDLIGQAQTGTGKTAAFGIPLVERVSDEPDLIQAVVLTPTRELAVQVAEELNKIGQYKKVTALPIYGGQDIQRQIRALKKHPQIIVATPGRFMDHMNRRTIRLHGVEMVVLDEADEMLNMGFVDDIKAILKEMPEERQTLLFSATMPRPIQEIARNFMKDPVTISIKAKELTVPNIQQHFMEVPEKQKFDVLCRLLDIHSPELAIIFGRTKRRVDELSEALNKRGYGAEGIHGDLNQAKRDSVLRKFKEGTIEVLVATDVAARGLDISGVTHVYNFDIPQDSESYVHRIGRTGRAGKTGLAITLVTPREIDHLRYIEKATNRRMERKPVPTMAEAIEGQQRLTVDRLMETAGSDTLNLYRSLAEQLLEETDSVTLVAAALKLLTKEPDTTPVRLTEESPLRVGKKKMMDFPRGRGPRSGAKRSGPGGGGGYARAGHSKGRAPQNNRNRRDRDRDRDRDRGNF